ncbi:tetratricopeptide repeat protein [Streptomyces sp. NPDC057253]|uniref:tetratricopeptide repeat protein n=1 Tax=Streptomyces sp. NPDC057253 TaxID=3346069 RepID=UPI0036387503
MHHRLAALGPYLWIVDDVPEGISHATFRALLAPTTNGRTLMTARHELRGWVHPDRELVLPPLERSASLALLTSRWPHRRPERAERRLERLRRDRHQYAAARRTVAALGAHPLALSLAAGLCGAPDITGIADFTAMEKLVADPDRDALALAEQLRPKLPTHHLAGIAAILARGLSTLPEEGRDVLLMSSFLGRAPLPAALIALVLAEADGLPDAEATRRAMDGLDQTTAEQLSQRHGGTDDLGPADDGDAPEGAPIRTAPTWTFHPLVHEAARRSGLHPHRRQRLRLAAVTVFARELDATREGRQQLLPAGILPHVERLAEGMQDVDEWHLLNEAGRLHTELGDSHAALRLFRELHEMCLARLGENHFTTLVVQLGLGVAHGQHGEHTTARRLLEATHEALARQLGVHHPDTLTAWNNLAVAHGSAGDHDRARNIFRSLHEIREKTLGPHHPDTLDSLTNYAVHVGGCGDHATALDIKNDLYRTFRSIYGEEHDRTLDALTNLAATTLQLADTAGARQMLDTVHRTRRRLRASRTRIADAAENLAVVADDPREAVGLLTDAYRSRLRAQGPAHPAATKALHRLLAMLIAQTCESGAPARSGPALPVASVTTEPAQALPAGVTQERIRLDHERMDERIALLEEAIRLYDTRLAAFGPDAVETMTAVCYLAHAHAALDQFDEQYEEAWVLIDDATTGLELTLGTADATTRAADDIRMWITTLGAERDTTEAGGDR